MPPLGGRTVLVGGRNIRRPCTGGRAYGNGSRWYQRGANDPGGRRGSHRPGRSHVGDLGNARKCGRRGSGRSHLPTAWYRFRGRATGDCQPPIGIPLAGCSGEIEGLGARKKRLERKRSRRLWQPSPRTAKPRDDPMSGWPTCKCHFRNACVDMSTPGVRTRSNWGNCVWRLLFL